MQDSNPTDILNEEKEEDTTVIYDPSDEPLVISTYLIKDLLREDNFLDAMGLYNFYYYTAKWQKTNQVKATNSYLKKCLNIGYDRLHNAQETLIKSGLIERITRKDNKGIIRGYYIKINFMWRKAKTNEIIHNNDSNIVDNPTSGFQQTNALSTDSINALSTDNINALENSNNFFKTNEVTIPITNIEEKIKEFIEQYDKELLKKEPNFMDKLRVIFRMQYFRSRGYHYAWREGIDTKHLGILVSTIKKLEKPMNTEEAIIWYYDFFGKCTAITEKDDLFLSKISMAFLDSQINQYMNYIKKNGRTEQRTPTKRSY